MIVDPITAARLRPQTAALLSLLQARGSEGVSALDVLRVVHSYRAGARVFELRQAGYQIRTERHAGKTATYFFEG